MFGPTDTIQCVNFRHILHFEDYSARIWKDTDRLASELKGIVEAAIINGEGSRTVAQKLAARMGVNFSHALRLVRTETSRILNQATADRMEARGIKRYRFVAIHDNRTCGRCLKKDGKSFAFKDKKVGLNFPPLHPHCRCTIIPDMTPEDGGKHWLRDLLDKWKAGKLKPRGAVEKAVAEKGEGITEAEVREAAERQEREDKAEEERQRQEINRTRWRIVGDGNATRAERITEERKEAIRRERAEVEKQKTRVDRMFRLLEYYPGGDKISTEAKKAAEDYRKGQKQAANREQMRKGKGGVIRKSAAKAAREEAEAVKKAIIDKADKLAWQNVQEHRSANDIKYKINLTETQARTQVEYYRDVLDKALENKHEETEAAIREYMQRLGIEDRTEDFLKMYPQSVAKRSLPPYIVTDTQRRTGAKYTAYHSDGMVRIHKDATNWSGNNNTLRHEMGHYLDRTILRRKYEWIGGKLKVTSDPYNVQALFEEDKKELNKRTNPKTWHIGRILVRKDAFKTRGRYQYYEYPERIQRITEEMASVIYGEEGHEQSEEVEKVLSQMSDALQSVLGGNNGRGHTNEYVRARSGTNLEAVAQIFASITKYHFIDEMLKNATGGIKRIFEDEEGE